MEIGSFEEALKLPNSCWVTHLAERFGLDLADALARDAKLPAYFLERAAVAVDQAETLFEHLALSIGQGLENVFDLLLEQRDRGHVARIFRAFVLDEIAEIRFLALADRRLE